MQTGSVAVIRRDLCNALLNKRVKVLKLTAVNATVELLEDADQASCWKKGNVFIVQPHQIEEVQE